MDTRAAPGRAPSALLLSAGLVAAILAWGRAPASWEASFRPFTGVGVLSSALDRPAPGLGWIVPVLEIAVRADALVVLVVAAVAVGSCSVARRLYGDRGPGGWFAVLATGPLVALALAADVSEMASREALRELVGLGVGLGAIAIAWGVDRGTESAVEPDVGTRARALGVAGLACAWDLGAAWAWGVIAFAIVVARERGDARGSASIAAYVGALAPAIALFVGLRIAGAPWPRLPRGVLAFDVTALPAAPWPSVIVFAGTALLVLRVLLVRDALAGLVLVLVVLGTSLRVGTEALLGSTSALVLLAIAAAGWCAEVGTWWASPRGGAVLASVACTGVLVPAVLGLPRARPLADRRVDRPAFSFHARGLIAPRDAVVVYGPWSSWLDQVRALEGFRPDVELAHGHALGESALLQQILVWDEDDRRVLSDSFDAAGRWDPERVADSGPLFWYVGRPVPHGDEFTDLSHLEPALESLPAREKELWVALQIERSRYRRARGAPEEALEALPLPLERKASLRTRLLLARSAGPEPNAASELHTMATDVAPEARVAAEAGDLLYAHGEPRRGTELLLEAYEAGDAEALAALARWQVRAGQAEAADMTLQLLVTADERRVLALEMLHWLVNRDRIHEATRLVERLDAITVEPDASGELAAQEIAARLRVLAREATLEPAVPTEKDTSGDRN